MNYILLIAIGPVQAFIASARRSRDLWYGSWLLSELSKAVAHSVAQSEVKKENALVFPGVTNISDLAPNSELNVANKIVAIIENEPSVIAQKAEDAMEARLKTLRDDALNQIFRHAHIKPNLDKASDQIMQMPEFYWVAVPFDIASSDEGEYASKLADAERLMAARKSLRHFEPVSWGGNVPKSSISGELESVIDEDAYPTPKERRSQPEEVKRKVDALYNNFKVRGAERVSGVDLLKRHGNREGQEHFPSTSHFAAYPFVNALRPYEREPAIQKAWQTYIEELGVLAHHEKTLNDEPIIEKYDASLLYEGRLHELLDGQSDKKKDACYRLLGELHQALKKENVPALQSYYALMLGDGDSVGKALNKIQSYKHHQAFSTELDKFSRGVEAIIRGDGGRLIYAGGDDVLAFLPVDSALACAAEIAQDFQGKMDAFFGGEKIRDKDGKPIASPTFSAGIAIVHHLEPLSDALTLVRKTEGEAKSVTGKNAVAIAVDKRSGVTRTIKGTWLTLGGRDKRLSQLIDHFRNGAIPKNTAFHIQDSVQKLGGRDKIKTKDAAIQTVLDSEIGRIIGRRDVDDDAKLAIQSAYQEGKLQVIDELIIAGFLASLHPPKPQQSEEVSQ